MKREDFEKGWPETTKRMWAQMERFGVNPKEDQGEKVWTLDGREYLLEESLAALEAMDIDGMDAEDQERAFWDALVPAE